MFIPEEERKSFMAENDVTVMSTREFKQTVLERDQALSEKAELQNALEANQDAATKITFERDELRKQASSLQAVRIKLSANKGFLYNSIAKEYEELLKELNKLAPADPEAHETCKNEVSGLIGKITERL
ncbi:DUF3102 domain-containing protein [Desulfosporosinus youngiae]|uniref:DUF3102 domain-containing protein n=1 Tax=Desulfosporosinus youngiae TaxID=339862 RepID=UPI00249F5572|nr:DUF3102 domain-containing protein [Desulfosporosinus youngiae]